MKKYLSLLRIRFLTGLQYRTAAAAGAATQLAWGMMELLLFRAFYRANASAFPMTFQQLAAYIWLQQAFMPLVMNWLWDMELFE
ncbi:MAG: ABC transporter permease, partial [Clostridia bacterium]